MSIYLFVPSVFSIILAYIYAHEWFCHKLVTSGRFHSTRQVTFFFAMSSAGRCTFWSEHDSAYCAIHKHGFWYMYKGQTCIGIGCLSNPCNTASYMYLFRWNRVLQQWSTNSYRCDLPRAKIRSYNYRKKTPI